MSFPDESLRLLTRGYNPAESCAATKPISGTGLRGFSEPVRIIPAPGEPQGQLYDMDTDRVETNNLWGQNPEVVARLTELLARYGRQGRLPAGRAGIGAMFLSAYLR